MNLSPPLLARWCAAVSRTASVLRPVDIMALLGAACAGILASMALVPGSWGVCGAGLAVLMSAIAVVDARRFIIPDGLNAAAAALGVVYAAVGEPALWMQAISWSLLRGAVAAFAFLAVRAGYRWWRGREGIGLGDVKLAGVAGIWLDWTTIPIAIEIAAVAALAAYGIMHLYSRRAVRRTTRLPFGLFLAPAIWIAWLLEMTLPLYPSASSY